MKWNGLRSQKIRRGQVLEILIEGAGPAPKRNLAASKDTTAAKKSVSYTVKKGDTLQSIASAFRVTVNGLKQWNKIRGSKIQVGQELVINS